MGYALDIWVGERREKQKKTNPGRPRLLLLVLPVAVRRPPAPLLPPPLVVVLVVRVQRAGPDAPAPAALAVALRLVAVV